jgi:hypothetical protein
MRTAIVFLIALVAVAAFVLAGPRGFGVLTTNRSDGEHTQQTSGESVAGRAQDMPASEAGDRADTNESGRRAQALSRSETSAPPVSSSQAQSIKDYFAKTEPIQSSMNFGAAIGASVPRQIPTRPLPPEVVEIMQKFRGDEYVMVENRMIVVEPKSRRIVAILSL